MRLLLGWIAVGMDETKVVATWSEALDVVLTLVVVSLEVGGLLDDVFSSDNNSFELEDEGWVDVISDFHWSHYLCYMHCSKAVKFLFVTFSELGEPSDASLLNEWSSKILFFNGNIKKMGFGTCEVSGIMFQETLCNGGTTWPATDPQVWTVMWSLLLLLYIYASMVFHRTITLHVILSSAIPDLSQF